MSIIRTLEHFTQDEVDKAPGEILTKDLPYGGNRPYVIGTILRNSTNGEYITWKRLSISTEHRVCIEHEPDEFVAWKVAPAGTSSLEIPLRDLGGSGLGEVRRVGFVQLAEREYAATSLATVRPTDVGTEDERQNAPHLHFFKNREASEINQGFAAWANGSAHEVDPYIFKPLYLTHSVFISDCRILNNVVFYCVYKKHSGLLEGEIQMMTHSDYGEIGFYNIRVPARRCGIQYVTASLVHLSPTSITHVMLTGTLATTGGSTVRDLFMAGGNNGYSTEQIGNSTIDPYWGNSEGNVNSLDYCYDLRGYATMNNTFRPRGKVVLQIKHYSEE